jgi:hypothetical protein
MPLSPASTKQPSALERIKSTPNAIWFVCVERVSQTLELHRTATAERLGGLPLRLVDREERRR